MRAFALLALVAGAGAWDLGKTASGAKIGGYKALADRPQETQTMELVCNGANPATGCNVDQTNPATRTWTGNWCATAMGIASSAAPTRARVPNFRGHLMRQPQYARIASSSSADHLSNNIFCQPYRGFLDSRQQLRTAASFVKTVSIDIGILL